MLLSLGHFRKYCRRSPEELIGLLKNTGDEIAGATGTDVTLRAERKLGGSAEALAPQTLRSVFIAFWRPAAGHGDSPEEPIGLLKNTGDEIAALPPPDTLEPLYRNGENAQRNCPTLTELAQLAAFRLLRLREQLFNEK